MKKFKQSDVINFLQESNAIEGVYSKAALEDAQKAWKYLLTVDTLTTDVVLKVHKLLMNRLNPEIAGQLRGCTVYIGGQIKPFFSHALLREAVDLFCEETNLTISISPDDKEKCCKDLHIEFENVHCHQDGNGRTGRLLMNWQRWKMGLPILIIHEGEEQQNYYSWFRQ